MSLKARVTKLEALQPKGVLAFINMLEPRYHGMTTEEAVKAAGYDQLGPNDCLYVFCARDKAADASDRQRGGAAR